MLPQPTAITAYRRSRNAKQFGGCKVPDGLAPRASSGVVRLVHH